MSDHPDLPNGWYQIERAGLYPNARAGVIQVLDAPAFRSIVNNFEGLVADYSRTYGREFPGFPIDEEHIKLSGPYAPSAANGWLMNVRLVGDDELQGDIKWTATGAPKVAGGTFRFVSTEYDPSTLEPVNGDQQRVRPTRLTGLTLTNLPNNQGARPLTNRKPPEVPLAPPAEPPQEPKMKRLLLKLGLAAEASEDAALDALTTVLNRETDQASELARLKGEVTTLTNRATTAEAEIKAVINREAAATVDALATTAKLSPEEKADAVALYLTNRAGYDRYAARLTGTKPAPPAVPTLQNRATPPAIPAPAGSPADASAVRTAAEAIQRANPKRPWSDCWRQAEAAQAKA